MDSHKEQNSAQTPFWIEGIDYYTVHQKYWTGVFLLGLRWKTFGSFHFLSHIWLEASLAWISWSLPSMFPNFMEGGVILVKVSSVGGAINFPYILVLMLIFWLCGVSSRRDLAHPFFQSTVSTVQQQYITLLLTENTLGDHKDSHPYCAQPSTRLLHPYLE